MELSQAHSIKTGDFFLSSEDGRVTMDSTCLHQMPDVKKDWNSASFRRKQHTVPVLNFSSLITNISLAEGNTLL
jgi:hypothetical protein